MHINNTLIDRLRLHRFLKTIFYSRYKRYTPISNINQAIDMLLIAYLDHTQDQKQIRDLFIRGLYQKYFEKEIIMCSNDFYFSLVSSIINMKREIISIPMIKDFKEFNEESSQDLNITLKSPPDMNKSDFDSKYIFNTDTNQEYYFDLSFSDPQEDLFDNVYIANLNIESFLSNNYQDIYKIYRNKQTSHDIYQFIARMGIHFAYIENFLKIYKVKIENFVGLENKTDERQNETKVENEIEIDMKSEDDNKNSRIINAVNQRISYREENDSNDQQKQRNRERGYRYSENRREKRQFPYELPLNQKRKRWDGLHAESDRQQFPPPERLRGNMQRYKRQRSPSPTGSVSLPLDHNVSSYLKRSIPLHSHQTNNNNNRRDNMQGNVQNVPSENNVSRTRTFSLK